jgi:xyloglucan:xyloglucosyl transferase
MLRKDFDGLTHIHCVIIRYSFMVDDTPIRIYKNNEDLGVPFPSQQPMSVFASLWNGEEWATQNGAIRLNWTNAPFVATYKGYEVEGCEVAWYNGNVQKCMSTATDAMLKRTTIYTLNTRQRARLHWVTENLLVYDYCRDIFRYPTPHPECGRNSGLQVFGPLPLGHLRGLQVLEAPKPSQ